MGTNPVTIKDLAKILEVAPSTVSRALRNHPNVSVTTKKQIIELAEKLGYTPNPIAVSLKGQKTKTIGVVVPEFVHYFFSTVIKGIEKEAVKAGYNLLVCSSNGSFDREVSMSKLLLSQRVDGLLISLTKNAKNDEHLKDYLDRWIPMVIFDSSIDTIEVDKVIIDDFKSAKLAVTHLLEQGCKTIAYLGGPPTLLINQQRFKGYQSALESYGIKLDQSLVQHVEEGSAEEGRKMTRKVLDNPNKIDGLFATADIMAIGAMKEIKHSNLEIPDDVAVVGFGNSDISHLYEPALTSIMQPGENMGAAAMQMLIHRMQGEEGSARTQVLHTELLVRASSNRNDSRQVIQN